MSCVCVSVLVFCCSVSSLFLSCVLCACDLLIVLNYGCVRLCGGSCGVYVVRVTCVLF